MALSVRAIFSALRIQPVITVAFSMQRLVHMVVCLDLLPPKGIPLLLVSYGKTEMLVSLVSIGVLLNLSREVNA